MVQTREFRIVMPLSLDEYQVAQMYMVMRMQQQNTKGTEGVEVLENRPFEDDEFGKGQYTLKIYRLQSKAPTWLTTFAPADALLMQEEAWNAYPRCKSVIKCPYFPRFLLTIETIHKEDSGQSQNVHCLTEEQLAIRQVDMIDIATDTSDYWSYVVGSSNVDFSRFKSAMTGRGPLLDGWQGERALFLESHRNCLAWIDEWFGLSMEMMRNLEKQSDSSLNQKLRLPCLMSEEEQLDDI